MPWNNTAKHLQAAAMTGVITHVSLHNGDPSTTGANESDEPRQSVTWASPSGGAVSASNQPAWADVDLETYTHIGLWSASTAGTFYGGIDITDVTFSVADNTATLTSLTLTWS